MKKIDVVLANSEPIQLVVSTSTDWPIVLVGLGSVCTTVVIAYITRANQRSQSKAKQAELRQEWITGLRTFISEFISLVGAISLQNNSDENYRGSEKYFNQMQNLYNIRTKIILMFSTSSVDSLIISSLLNDLYDHARRGEKPIKLKPFRIALEEQAQRVLEKAWASIKDELAP